jgi:hypothetical protein
MRNNLWRTIGNWFSAFSFAKNLAMLVTAFGGGLFVSYILRLWGNVTGIWFRIECCGVFGLFLGCYLWLERRDKEKRILEIVGAILYAQLIRLSSSEPESILVKIRLQPSRPKNIKAFALSVRHGDKVCDGERLPIYGPMFIDKLPDGVHHWRKLAEQEKVEGDIESKLADNDALLLSSPCSGWLNFACRGITLKNGDTVAMILTVTDETGYGFTIRDDLVHVH